MADEPYNGWVNYETWAVFTWLNNEESPYRLLRHLARGEGSDRDKADRLEAWIMEGNPLPASLYSDLLLRALGRVRWDEVIKAAKED